MLAIDSRCWCYQHVKIVAIPKSPTSLLPFSTEFKLERDIYCMLRAFTVFKIKINDNLGT